MASMPYGDPTDPANLMGPLISERQRRRVLGYIDTAQAEGATVALGGGVPTGLPDHLANGFFVEPTVLVDVAARRTPSPRRRSSARCSPCWPTTATTTRCAIANDSIYGLSGAVFSASDERARAVADRVRTGTICVNGGLYYAPTCRSAATSRAASAARWVVLGFEEYLETKSIAIGVK